MHNRIETDYVRRQIRCEVNPLLLPHASGYFDCSVWLAPFYSPAATSRHLFRKTHNYLSGNYHWLPTGRYDRRSCELNTCRRTGVQEKDLGHGDGLQRGDGVPVMAPRVDLKGDVSDVGELDAVILGFDG